MLTEKQLNRAYMLFGKSFLRRRWAISGMPELRDLLRRATPEQRRLITRADDPEVRLRVLDVALEAWGIVFELADPIVSRIDGVWVPPDRFPGNASAGQQSVTTTSAEEAHDAACAPRRKPRSRRHAPPRSWNGQRPWAHRLGGWRPRS